MGTSALQTVLVLLFAVTATSLTITKAKVSAPFRRMVKQRSSWLGELFSCPYCFSHWLCFGAVTIYRPELVTGAPLVVNLFVTAMAMVAASALLVGLVFTSISLVHAPAE